MCIRDRPNRAQQQIEEHVRPLMGDPKARGLSTRNQLREPSVVEVASQVGGLDVPVPEARNEYGRRHKQDPEGMAAHKPCRARERGIAALLGDNVTEFFGSRGNGIQVRALYRSTPA